MTGDTLTLDVLVSGPAMAAVSWICGLGILEKMVNEKYGSE
jgi:hypothetical protein